MPTWLVRLYADELPRLLAQQQEMMNAASVYPWLTRHQRGQVNARLNRVQRLEPVRPKSTAEWERGVSGQGIPIKRVSRKEPARPVDTIALGVWEEPAGAR